MANPLIHVCGAEAQGSAMVGKRRYRWEFHAYCGPIFVRADGEPLAKQPGEGHRVWAKFEEWLKDYRKSKGE